MFKLLMWIINKSRVVKPCYLINSSCFKFDSTRKFLNEMML